MDFLPRIKQGCDAVISISSGGGTGMTVEQRLDVVFKAQPELTTLNRGTMNYGGYPMIEKFKGRWKFDWEEPYLESTRSEPFVSTFADIEYMLEKIGDLGTRFECEAYDVGHLYTVAHFLDRGLVKTPFFLCREHSELTGLCTI